MNDRLFDLVVYLVSCSRLSLDEPVIYGSFRLLEGASRLIDGETDDAFLLRCREEIEAEKLKMIDDPDGYREFLDRLLREVAAEATRRNLEMPSTKVP
jgi:uncharacterized protein DUF6092